MQCMCVALNTMHDQLTKTCFEFKASCCDGPKRNKAISLYKYILKHANNFLQHYYMHNIFRRGIRFVGVETRQQFATHAISFMDFCKLWSRWFQIHGRSPASLNRPKNVFHKYWWGITRFRNIIKIDDIFCTEICNRNIDCYERKWLNKWTNGYFIQLRNLRYHGEQAIVLGS